MNCTFVIVHCLEGLRVRTVTFEGKNLLQQIYRLCITIYIYIYPPMLMKVAIAGTDWQTVELQVFLSAEGTIRIASVSELLRGK